MASTDILNADFGLVPLGGIGDRVFVDLNGDGIRDGDEPGIAGVVVDLFDAGGGLVDSVTTAGDGSYGFSNLPAGDYSVVANAPSGLSPTVPGPDPSGDDHAKASPYAVTVEAGVTDNRADFGFVGWARVGDFVYRDADGDGRFDGEDGPLGGVVVSLIDDGSDALVGTTVTAADGRYGFAAVRPGSYRVEIDLPAGFALSDATGPDSQPNPHTITVASTDILNADFGLVPLEPSIAADKAVLGAPVLAASGVFGHYDVTFVVSVLNTGDVALDGLSLVDDLGAQFGPSLVRVVAAPEIGAPGAFTGGSGWGSAPAWVSGLLPGHSGFTGLSPHVDLITGAGSALADEDRIAPGEGIEIRFTVEIDPDAGILAGRSSLANQAIVTGQPVLEGFGQVLDHSDSGFNPLVDDESQPFEATGRDDDATVLLIPRIELTKSAQSLIDIGPAPSDASDGTRRTVRATFSYEMINTGSTALTGLSMSDAFVMQNQVPAVSQNVLLSQVGDSETQAFQHSGVGGVLTDFNSSGTAFLSDDTALPLGGTTSGAGRLAVGERVSMTVAGTFVLDLEARSALTSSERLSNSATLAAHTDSDGDGLADYHDPTPFDPDQSAAVTGAADPGPDLIRVSDGDGLSGAGNPVTVSFADLQVTKQVIGYQQRDHTAEVRFLVTAENVGDVALSRLQIVDDLSANFGDAFDAVFDPGRVVLSSYTDPDGLTRTGGSAAAAIGLTANMTRYSGDPDLDARGALLVDASGAGWTGSLLPAGGVLRFIVTAPLDTYRQPDFAGANSATGQASDPKAPDADASVTDVSDSGDEARDDLRDPGVDPTDDPTPVPGLVALKSLEAVSQNSDDPTRLDVTYRLIAVNAGSTALVDINLEDDLARQFGDAFIGASDGGRDPGAGVSVLSTLSSAELPMAFASLALQSGAVANRGFDGSADVRLLEPGFMLPSGRFVAVELTVTVDPDAAPLDAFGRRLELGNSSAAQGYLDTDSDGVAELADSDGDGDFDGPVLVRDDASDDITGDPTTPREPGTPTTLPRLSIGVAKTVVNLSLDTDAQILTQVFDVAIRNYGTVTLYDLSLSDDQVAMLGLDAAAAGLLVTGATQGDPIALSGFVAEQPASAECSDSVWTFAPDFDGGLTAAHVLVAGGGSGPSSAGNCLAAEETVRLRYALHYDFASLTDATALAGANKVVAGGSYDANADGDFDPLRLADESTTGSDPDGGDNGLGAGDVDPLTRDNGAVSAPGDAQPNEDDPTLLKLPLLAVTKEVTSVLPLAGRDAVAVTWRFDLHNQGNAPVYDFGLIDDLRCIYGDAFIGADIPVVQVTGYSPGGLGSAGTGVNPGYRGASTLSPCSATPDVSQAGTSADLLDGAGVLMPGDRLQVLLTATLDPEHPAFAQSNRVLGVYTHRLPGYDSTDPTTEVVLTDEGAGPQGDDRTGSTPSSGIVLTKQLLAVRANAQADMPPQALDAQYRLRLENTGSSAVSNVSIVDEALSGFGAGFLQAEADPVLSSLPSADASFAAVNTGYDGRSGVGAELLALAPGGLEAAPTSSLLMPGDALALDITVTFDPDVAFSDPFQTDPKGRIAIVSNAARAVAALDRDGDAATGPETVDHDANPATADQIVTVSDLSDDSNPADLQGDGMPDDDFDGNGAFRDDRVATLIPDLTVVMSQRGTATTFTGTTPAGVDCLSQTDEGFCYAVVFALSLTNTGSSNLTNVQLVDDLEAQFTAAGLAPVPAGAADAFLGAAISELAFVNASRGGLDLSLAPTLNAGFNGFSAGSSATLATNGIGGGTGVGDPNLFTNLTTPVSPAGLRSLLEPGDQVTALITAYVYPFILGVTAPDGSFALLENAATGYAYTDSDRDGSPDVADSNTGAEGPGDTPNPAIDLPTVEDLSDDDGNRDGVGDAADTDPGDSDGDGDPTNDDATAFVFPGLKVVQRLTGVEMLSNSQNYRATYSVKVTNVGSITLEDVLVANNLTDAFGSAFVQVLDAPSLVAADSRLSAPSRVSEDWLNPLFDGGDLTAPGAPLYEQELLVSSGRVVLAPGDFFTLTYSAEIDFDANTPASRFAVPFDSLTHVSDFSNAVVASALPVDDALIRTRIQDWSDNDANGDGRGEGDNDGTSGNDDDPTPAPGLLTEKSVVSAVVPSSAAAVEQLGGMGSAQPSGLIAPADAFTGTQNVYVARFRFDWVNTGSVPLFALDLDDQLAQAPGINRVLQASFVSGSLQTRRADSRCTAATALWSADFAAGMNAFDGSAVTLAFESSGNALGLCEHLSFEIDVEFEIDSAHAAGWSNAAVTTFGVDLDADGLVDAQLHDFSDGDGDPRLDSDPTGAGPSGAGPTGTSGGDPGDDPTRVPLARLGLAKTFLPDPEPVTGMPSFFDYTVQITVENIGDVPLTGLRVTDDEFWNEWYDVAAAKSGALAPYEGVALVGGPVLMAQSKPDNASLSTALNPNPSASTSLGETSKPVWSTQPIETADPRVILLDGAQLGVGESFTLQFVIRLNPFGFEMPLEGFLGNHAEAIAEEADPADLTAPRFSGLFTYDLSDSGTNPRSDNPSAPRLDDDPNTFENASPLPNPAPPSLRLTKQAMPETVQIGDFATWKVTVENLSVIPAIDVDIIDVLPAGLVPLEATFQFDNSKASTATEPVLSVLDSGAFPLPSDAEQVTIGDVTVTNRGPVLQFEGVDLDPGDTLVLSFKTQTTIALDVGVYLNQAYAFDDKWVGDRQLVSSTVAQGALSIRPTSVFDCATVIGQVFHDENGDGYQRLTDEGVPAARISSLVAGTALEITTDKQGRFHLPCSVIPNQDRGTNVVLKLDPRTLPAGYRLTTENPRVIRVTRGKMTEANFGVTSQRVVTLNLNSCAFAGNSDRLTRHSQIGVQALIAKLKEGRSILRVSYRAHDETDAAIARRRASLQRQVKGLWRRAGGPYPVEMEFEIVRVLGTPSPGCRAK